MARKDKLMNMRKKLTLVCVLGALLCAPALMACGRASVSLQAPIAAFSIAQDR